MDLEIANKILNLARRTNECFEEMLKIQNELHEVVSGLTEEDHIELNSFAENNEFLQSVSNRNKEIFTALGWQVE